MQWEWASVPGVRPADVQTGARSRCMRAAIRSWSAAMRFWRCSGVTLWRCSGVTLGRCSGVALGRCSGVALGRCSGVAQPRTANTINDKVADFHILMTIPFRYCDWVSVRLLAATRQFLTGRASIVAFVGRHRSMTYRSNYCAVDPGNSDVLPKTKPRRGAEALARLHGSVGQLVEEALAGGVRLAIIRLV
jgi:hypothetical protein